VIIQYSNSNSCKKHVRVDAITFGIIHRSAWCVALLFVVKIQMSFGRMQGKNASIPGKVAQHVRLLFAMNIGLLSVTGKGTINVS